MLLFKRAEISQVFTPRAAEVNQEMYVPRPSLERELLRALAGSKHILIHGESGAGKSWLYKKKLADLNREFEVVNCANVARKNSFDDEFENIVNRKSTVEKVGYTEKRQQR